MAAMVAGGQLSPAPLAVAAAPYIVRVGGYFAVGAFDALLLNGLVAEVKAIKSGQCKP